MDEKITSRENAKIKYACRLSSSAAFRRSEGRFLAEGRKLCPELARGAQLETLFYTESAMAKCPELAGLPGEHYLVEDHVADKLADVGTHQGVFGVFRTPVHTLDEVKAGGRYLALERVQDPGNVGIAVILPAVLLLLFGYGMSMDIKNVRIAYLAVPASSQSTDLETRLTLSRYFQTTRVFSTREAEEKLRTHEADAFIALQSNAPDTLHNGTTKVQIVVNGVNANQATLIRNYLQAVVGSWASSLGGRTAPVLDVQTRTRFNEANDSHYYLVPGVIVTIMTMIGALLTSLVMAREYERGTLESLFVTPVGSGEILAAKAATNFLLGMVSLAISMLFAAFVFGIPIRGSLTLLLAVSALFLIVALGLGLVISTATKNQFLACQFAIMGTFMPALMLSGFLYDILNMPPAVRAITYLIPARYYVTLLQTLFLAGDIPSVIIPCCITLGVFAVVLMGIARMKAPKSLE